MALPYVARNPLRASVLYFSVFAICFVADETGPATESFNAGKGKLKEHNEIFAKSLFAGEPPGTEIGVANPQCGAAGVAARFTETIVKAGAAQPPQR